MAFVKFSVEVNLMNLGWIVRHLGLMKLSKRLSQKVLQDEQQCTNLGLPFDGSVLPGII